jgi:hypothetical protein
VPHLPIVLGWARAVTSPSAKGGVPCAATVYHHVLKVWERSGSYVRSAFVLFFFPSRLIALPSSVRLLGPNDKRCY